MVGGFVAATIVTLAQFVRLRDRRLLLLAALFAFQAQALSREWFDFWKDVFQAAACAAGLALLLALSPRSSRPGPPAEAGPPAVPSRGGEPPTTPPEAAQPPAPSPGR